MLLSDDEIKERIESPLNLLNRLKTSLNRAISKSGSISQSPCLPPTANDIIPDLEDKIVKTSARSKALDIMLSAMNELQNRLPEVQRPEKLADIALNMSRVITNHEANRAGLQTGSQIIVYAPQVQNIENYEVIDVAE